MGLLEKAERDYQDREEAKNRNILAQHHRKALEAVAYFINAWEISTEAEDWKPSTRTKDDSIGESWVEATLDGVLVRFTREDGRARTKVWTGPNNPGWRTFNSLAELYQFVQQVVVPVNDVDDNDVARAQRDLISTEAQLSGKPVAKPKRRTIMEWLRG